MLWPVLTSVRSQRRWGLVALSSVESSWRLGKTSPQSAVMMPRSDGPELVSVLLSKQQKPERRSGPVITSNQD